VASRPLDRIDRDILGVLAQEGRITWQALADRVRLSPSATTDRVRRLERDGTITGYGARIDPAAVGRRLEAWVAVQVDPPVSRERFEAAVRREVAVIDAVHLTGSADYELRVRCRDTSELDVLVRRLKDEHGATRTETRVVLDRLLGSDEVRLT
jgi:Lrp/AsnC family transcriptional regulator, leucine-responsive regulatory protein